MCQPTPTLRMRRWSARKRPLSRRQCPVFGHLASTLQLISAANSGLGCAHSLIGMRYIWTMDEKVISILETLIAVCKAGEELFELAANEVQSSPLQSTLRGYSLQRSRFSRELEAAAGALGKNVPAAEGTGESNEQMPAKEGDAVTRRNEQTVLSDCEREEEAAITAYAAALEETELPSAVRAMITAQAADVKAAHKEIRESRTRFDPQGEK